jgi:hypothetical protein
MVDHCWHDAEELSSAVGLDVNAVERELYSAMSRGEVVWMPRRLDESSIALMFRLVDENARRGAKPYPRVPVGEEVDGALERAVGDDYYYSGLAARYLYGLVDRFANLNLVEVNVLDEGYNAAASVLIERLSESYIVVPAEMPWDFVMQAMRTGTVLRIIPHYDENEKVVFNGRNVQRVSSLLKAVGEVASRSEYESIIEQARDARLLD